MYFIFQGWPRSNAIPVFLISLSEVRLRDASDQQNITKFSTKFRILKLYSTVDPLCVRVQISSTISIIIKYA